MLGRGIHRRGGIVEHQNGGIGHHAARDRQALALAAGETDAPLADPGIISQRQGRRVVVDLCGDRGIDQRGLLGLRIGVGDVAIDAVVEQEDILLNQANRVAQRIERDVANILAVERDPPARHVVEARDQQRERRFPGAGGTDNAQRLAGSDAERNIVQGRRRLCLRIVGEADRFEPQSALPRDQGQRSFLVANCRLQVEDFEQPPAGRDCARR